MNKKPIAISVAGLMWVYASAPAGLLNFSYAGASATLSAAEPCPPNVTAPAPDPDSGGSGSTAPAAPKSLRIVGGSGGDDALEADAGWDAESASGPFVSPEEWGTAAMAAAHDYFGLLISRPDCMTSFHFRSQGNIDLIPSRAENEEKIPIVYDAGRDGAKFEIDPSGSLAHSGSTGTPQKRMPIGIQGATSMLLTWDLKIASSMRWKSDQAQRVVNGETITVKYLDQHKSHRLDDRGASPWIGMKQNYVGAVKAGQGVAEFFFSAQTQFMGPGTARGSSEKITPVNGEFYVQPDVWTRVWVFVEGNIGTGDNAVRLSVWLADENRAPHQLYNRVNMITPPDGIGLFRYEFDSSLKEALNGPGQQWQRNFVILKGLTQAQVVGLLQKPTL